MKPGADGKMRAYYKIPLPEPVLLTFVPEAKEEYNLDMYCVDFPQDCVDIHHKDHLDMLAKRRGAMADAGHEVKAGHVVESSGSGSGGSGTTDVTGETVSTAISGDSGD